MHNNIDPQFLERALQTVRGGLKLTSEFIVNELNDKLRLSELPVRLRSYLTAEGKLLRPAVVLLSYYTVKPPSVVETEVDEGLISLAAAVELIHCASLIHDDIIDGDEERRGMSSLKELAGSHAAILFGDLLYSVGLELLSGLPLSVRRGFLRCVRMMCEAELKDIYEGAAGYIEVISGKTAELFAQSAASAVIIAGAPERAEVFDDYGRALGRAYQICDDKADGLQEAKVYDTKEYCLAAEEALSALEQSPYKESLLLLSRGLYEAG